MPPLFSSSKKVLLLTNLPILSGPNKVLIPCLAVQGAIDLLLSIRSLWRFTGSKASKPKPIPKKCSVPFIN